MLPKYNIIFYFPTSDSENQFRVVGTAVPEKLLELSSSLRSLISQKRSAGVVPSLSVSAALLLPHRDNYSRNWVGQLYPSNSGHPCTVASDSAW
jgi:hypothetical protein